MKRLDELLRQVQDRLVPPAVSLPELVRLMADDRAELRLIGRCVAADPVLASDALRVANSAAYVSALGPITDCVMAVIRLGEAVLFSIVAERLRGTMGASSLSPAARETMWRHALRVAITARLIARASRFTQPALAFTAGLLLDVGRIVLAEIAHLTGGAQALPRDGDDAEPLDARERLAFGIDHAAAGAMAARRWNIPEPIPSAIASSHHPMDARGEAKLPAVVVHAADAIVTAHDAAAGHDLPRYPVDPSALAALHLDDAAIARLVPPMELEYATIRRALGLSEEGS